MVRAGIFYSLVQQAHTYIEGRSSFRVRYGYKYSNKIHIIFAIQLFFECWPQLIFQAQCQRRKHIKRSLYSQWFYIIIEGPPVYIFFSFYNIIDYSMHEMVFHSSYLYVCRMGIEGWVYLVYNARRLNNVKNFYPKFGEY